MSYIYAPYTPHPIVPRPVYYRPPAYAFNPVVPASYRPVTLPIQSVLPKPAQPPATQVPIKRPLNAPKRLSKEQLMLGGSGLLAAAGTLAFVFTRKASSKGMSKNEPPLVSNTSPSSSNAVAEKKATTPKQIVSSSAHKPRPSNIEVPSEFKDPLFCEQLAYKIADASFAETLACLQNESPEAWSCFHKLETPLRKAVQSYLNPKCTVDFTFYMNDCKPYYSGVTSKTADRPGQHVRICSIDIMGNIPKSPEQIQNFYGTYCHEIRHLIQCFALGPEEEWQKKQAKPEDPCYHDYKKLIKPYFHQQWAQVYIKLGKDYPECQELDDLYVKHDVGAKLSTEQFSRFLNGMNNLWQRPGYPAIEEHKRFDIWKELFQKGDPKVVDYLVNHEVLIELEGYATFMKRAPNTPQIGYGKDLMYAAHFVFLRDLLRLYYDVRNTPNAERHIYTLPEYAKTHPLKLLS